LVEKKNDKYIAKVADFGMSRMTDHGAYVASDSKVPIKWTAPEVLRREAATSRSDVWSFGVLMWEIWEGGAEPYGWASNKEVYDDVLEGNILKPSKKMPQLIKDLMRKCLSTEAEERPTFQQIVEYFKAHRKEILASAPTTDSPKVTKVKEIEDPIITKEPSPYASSGPSQQHSSHYVQTPTDSLKPDEEVKKQKAKEPKEQKSEGNYGKTPIPIQQLQADKKEEEKQKEKEDSESDKEGNYLKTPLPKDEKKDKKKEQERERIKGYSLWIHGNCKSNPRLNGIQTRAIPSDLFVFC